MGRLLEELDYRPTAMGPLVLRRRWVAAIDTDVVEVILGDEHLMSSLFTVGETELAVRGLASVSGVDLRVLVGGLGLGYTARAALADPRVASVEVVDALAPVIEWHQAGLVPLGESLGRESRCRLVLGDFFGWFDAPRLAEAAYDALVSTSKLPRGPCMGTFNDKLVQGIASVLSHSQRQTDLQSRDARIACSAPASRHENSREL